MYRRLAVYLGLMVLILAHGVLAESPIPVESPGVPANSSICYRAPVTPIIDGDLSEWVENPETKWIGAAFKFMGTQDDVLDGRHSYWDGPADMSSTWSMMWDDDYLYFAAAITDDHLNKMEPPNIASLAQDITLFYMDTDGDLLVDNHLILGYGIDTNEPNQLYLMSSNNACIDPQRVLYPGHVAAHVMDERLGPAGRFVELAIPMEHLQGCGLPIAEVGGYFGINPAQEESYNTNQTDGGGFVCWNGDTAPLPVYFADPIYRDVIAYGPTPIDMAVDQSRESMLSWRAGDHAASHDIYFGTDLESVKDATKVSPEFKGNQPVAGVFGSYDPGSLTIGHTYYWRIDEVNDAPDHFIYTGDVWSFTIADFLVVDDFESYDDVDNPVFNTWLDGWDDADNGAVVGYPDPDIDAGEHYLETDIIHAGKRSMPFFYNTDGTRVSELTLPLDGPDSDLTRDGVSDLSLWFKGFPETIGSAVEGPAGVHTVRGAGADIWAGHDEFHFVYKEMTGTVTIIAKIESLQNDPGDPNTDPFAKAGIMIRDTLKGNSVYGSMLLSKENGIRNQFRPTMGANTERVFDPNLVAPYWVKINRSSGGLTRFYLSTDGETWTDKTSEYGSAAKFSLKFLKMEDPFYVGLAVTSHLEDVATEAVFSNVTVTGNGSDGPWLNQDVGMFVNEPEPLYIAVDGALLYYDDPAASLIDSWTEWRISLNDFVGKGVKLNDSKEFTIGVGVPSDMSRSGSQGQLFIDDIRLYLPEQN